MELIREKIELNFEDYMKDLKSLIAIPSVLEEDASEHPFGENIDRALKQTLSIAGKLGFKTYCDPNGYYGYADYGNGDEMVGILGHIDVVPAGDLKKWNTNPFEATIKDGKVFGRGTQDDKGPTLTAMYAFKALVDSGKSMNKKIRFIFGTDEENLWRGINEYNKKEQIPDYGFTPDSNFPLIYAEKGLLQVNLVAKNDTNVRICGGDAYNSVPSNISYKCQDIKTLSKTLDKFDFEHKVEGDTCTVIGKSMHAKDAEKGVNAISRLVIALSELGLSSKAMDFIMENIKEDALATKIFGNCEDEASGKLKFNIGKIDVNDEKEILNIDMRIPVSISKEFVMEKLNDAANRHGLEIEENDYLRSIYTPLDSDLVNTLMEAYVEVTGDEKSQPISSGGATYARAMDNCVAFGPAFPYSKETEHQPNEYVELDEIKKAMEVYSSALMKLLK